MLERLKPTGTETFPYIDEDGIPHESQLSYLQTEYLGLCRCGDPDAVTKYIKDFLERIEKTDWNSIDSVQDEFLCHWGTDKGYLKHGSTVRCSWLTDFGKELLRDLREVLKDV